jgi:hypothetical protein
MLFDIYVRVTASKYIGQVEASTHEEAEMLATEAHPHFDCTCEACRGTYAFGNPAIRPVQLKDDAQKVSA